MTPEQQKARVMEKLARAESMHDQKFLSLVRTLTMIKRWDKRRRYYQRQLDLLNAGHTITRPRKAHVPKRRLHL